MDWMAKIDALPDGERELITTITKTWLAKGEDPSVVAGHAKRWLNKNSDDGGGEGAKPPKDQRDPTEELEDLVNAHVAAHNIKRSVAYSRVLASRPDLNAALGRFRNAKLDKAARACGDGYGIR
jgi:hypothetical protein